jgi:dUTP pyrophosphatase
VGVSVPVVRLQKDARLPRYAHDGDAGCDLVAAEAHELAPRGGRASVGCGIAVEIPDGYAGFVLPRSGLALNHGVTCLNAPGLIDAGYRGELRVVLVNTDPDRAFTVSPGDRVAQLVVQRVEQVVFEEVVELSESTRGDGGFGSTGVSA